MSKKKAPRYRFEKYLQVPANFRQLILEKNLSQAEILTFSLACEETGGKGRRAARLSNTDIAAKNRISERSAVRSRTSLKEHGTILRWQKDPEFDAAFRAARRAAYGQTTAWLQQGSSAAATILMKVMLDPNTPASTRVRAAEIIVNHAGKAIEIEDIEARVTVLEEATGKNGVRR